MPVILNLIKESLKPVTLGAEGGHAIAPPLLFLLCFSLSKPIGALFLRQKPGSKLKELISLSVHISLNAEKQVSFI